MNDFFTIFQFYETNSVYHRTDDAKFHYFCLNKKVKYVYYEYEMEYGAYWVSDSGALTMETLYLGITHVYSLESIYNFHITQWDLLAQ